MLKEPYMLKEPCTLSKERYLHVEVFEQQLQEFSGQNLQCVAAFVKRAQYSTKRAQYSINKALHACRTFERAVTHIQACRLRGDLCSNHFRIASNVH